MNPVIEPNHNNGHDGTIDEKKKKNEKEKEKKNYCGREVSNIRYEIDKQI